MQTQLNPTALADAILVVIGGTTGLGLSAARAFLSAGASGVVVTGRSAESARAARETLGERARVLIGDAREPAHAGEAIELAVDAFGGFHGLYHVAGGSGRRMGDGPLHEVTDEGIGATLDLNLKSVILSNRAAVRHFRARKSGGAILNLSSVLAWSPSPKYFGTHVYTAAKAGIIGFTKSVAAYYAAENIRCNTIAPAVVDTPMARRAAGDPEIRRFIASKQPLDSGRIGRPEDCDAAAVYLLSDAARFVTGQVLAVDGGWSVTEGQIPVAP
jgi:NAD(P)-dependent dehydrogenase (short-subunit alcohol dehydrogenase family)